MEENDTIAVCAVCEDDFVNDEEVIKCSGLCLKKYHAKCLKFNLTIQKCFRDNRNVFYKCDDCIINPQDSMNATVIKFLSYLQIIDERIKRQDNKFDEVHSEINKMHESINDMNKNNLTVVNKVDHSVSELIEQNVNQRNTNRAEQVIVVQPKKSQKSDETKSDLTKNIDPKSIRICNIRNIPKGGIAINCSSKEEMNKLKDVAVQKMGEKYNVRIPDDMKLKIKITGMSENLSDEELIENITVQNEFMKNGKVKVVKIYENIRNKSFEAIIEVNKDDYNKLLDEQNINIGWSRCKVYEYVNVSRCFKCCGYNHRSAVCKNNLTCIKCGGNHFIKDCKASTSVCINCKIAVDKFKIKLDIFHQANSSKCPVLIKKLDDARKRAKFNS